MEPDYIFWITYLIPIAIGFGGGWVLRGVKYREDEADRRALSREVDRYFRGVEQAKQRHPAFRTKTDMQQDWERRWWT